MAVSLKTQKSIKYKLKRFLFDIKNTMKNKSFSFWILIINGVIVIFVFLIPILLRFDLVKKFVSYYFMSFPNLDYKVAYIALLGGLVGTIISITGALAVQNIFSKKELEKEKIQKKRQGHRLVHRVIANELNSNANIIFNVFGNTESITLASSQVRGIQKELSLERFNKFYEKILELHPELALNLLDIYSLFEKIYQARGHIFISKNEYEDFKNSYNNFQIMYNH